MKLKSLLAAAFVAASLTATAATPKYIFYYIGDGMGLGPVQAAQNYNRIVLGNSEPLTMLRMPVVSWCVTYSANSDITDSAAAGTALATGSKTRNGMLGMNADTIAVPSVASRLQALGYGVGITTSVAPDDATPGAFYAHVPSRKMFYEIGCQMAESGFQFVAGAGLRGLGTEDAPTDLLDKFADNNVQIVYGPQEAGNITSEKVLLLNPKGTNESNIGYTVDSPDGVLTLPFIAQTCLDHLKKTSPDKFFMMVEGGNIDHALHANDPGASVKEILAFDEAIGIAFDFYREHPDETLIIVTADHDTGGLVLVKPRGGKGGLSNVDYQKVSKEQFSEFCKALLKSRMNFTWDDMKEYLADNLGLFSHIKVGEKQEQKLREQFDRTFEQRNSADQQTLYASFNAFAVEVFNILNADSGISFATTSHSGNPVPVFAVGVGADEFRHFNNNDGIAPAIMRIVEQ